ncbi:hypothetical protein L7F22_067077 [Adiantum nelumboides]|nr:hypothetical protein [Adiantum nelumboides]
MDGLRGSRWKPKGYSRGDTSCVLISKAGMAVNIHLSKIKDLMFELSMWRCVSELRARVNEIVAAEKKGAKYYVEFWKPIFPNEPFRVILGVMCDKLYQTRERVRQLLATGKFDIFENETYVSKEQILEPLQLCYRSLCETDDKPIANGSLLERPRSYALFPTDPM